MTGVALCLLSATAYGTSPILVKLLLDDELSLVSLNALRFTIAAIAFAGLAALAVWRGRLVVPPRRTLLFAFALGCGPYASQVLFYVGAVQHISASIASLLFYTYPALVVLAGALLARRRPDRRRVVALVLASAGTVVVVAGGALDLQPLGCTLALGAAVANTVFLLSADRLLAGAEPFAVATMVTSGCGVTFLLASLIDRGPQLPTTGTTWTWLLALSLVATVVAVGALLAGVARVGASTASIVSTIEPVVTIALATVVFSERLSPVQLLGAAGVIAAIVVIQTGPRRAGRRYELTRTGAD